MADDTIQPALDSLSVNPDAPSASNQERDPRQDAGQDSSIQARLDRDPTNPQAQLDNGLDESMDASDPITATQPGGSNTEPPASSGYDPEQEAERQAH